MNFASFANDLVRHRPRRSAGLIAVEQVESTRLLAVRLVREYLREGAQVPETEIVAWGQASGRRRRSWSSPAGFGVYATLIRWKPVRRWLQILPLQTAVALCDAINGHLGGRCSPEWPNDLMVGGRKLGGLLVEAVAHADGSPAVALISFGIHHGGDPAAFGEPFGEPRATSVSREIGSGAVPPLPALALELIEALDRELARNAPAARIAERYRELWSHAVGDVLRLGVDGDAVEGRFLGFDDRGFLRLDVEGEERLLATGEVLGRG
jgi:BirA family biotin operon repressor/biotin-[acetyl-CoA-carboxylase] ligase